MQWGIALYFPAEQVKAAFEATAHIAEPATKYSALHPLLVTLPNGELLSLPFTSDYESNPVTLIAGGSGLELETYLLFWEDKEISHSDAPVHNYYGKSAMQKRWGYKPDKEPYVSIGYI